MSYLPFTLLAYFLNSIAVTLDKLLLTKHIPNPLSYIFYISLFSLLALFLLPFAPLPTFPTFLLASTSTVLWTTGLFCLYKGLQLGQVSRVVPVVGSLIPLLLLIYSSFTHSLSINQFWAVAILILGLVFLTSPNWIGRINYQEFLFEFISALFFALSYLILRQAYLESSFLTVLPYSRLVLIPALLIILILPKIRKVVLTNKGSTINFFSKAGLLFLIGQLAGGSQELLLTFSISLANPALVNSLQGTQYIFLLIFSLILGKKFPDVFKNKLSPLILASQIAGIGLVAIGIYLLAIYS